MPTTLRGRPRLPVAVEPRDGYRIWLRYADGVEGEVDLSDLAGKGLFVAWRDRVFFENVRIGEWGEIVWGEALDICPDALYLQLTGQSVEDIWPGVTADRQSSSVVLAAGFGTAPPIADADSGPTEVQRLPGPEEPGIVRTEPEEPQNPKSGDSAMQWEPEFDPFRPVAVEPRDGYRIWLRYADGTEGEVDLSHLVGKGVFAAWLDRDFFARVRIGSGDAIAWSDEIDICPDSLYQRLTGKFPEEITSTPTE